jgi:hypothetical protein
MPAVAEPRIFRKMTFSALASVLSITAFATESQAANRTGCNVGVAGGLSAVTGEPLLSGVDGTQIGIAAGCDYQFGRFVAGYESKQYLSTFRLHLALGRVARNEIEATKTVGLPCGRRWVWPEPSPS